MSGVSATGSYLDRIVADRVVDLAAAKAAEPLDALRERLSTARATLDFEKFLRAPGMSLIGEIKRSSPSKGALSLEADPAAIAAAYATNGVRAISVLTEPRHFNGSLADMELVRRTVDELGIPTPVLRKDFMFDPYQLVEARLHGADTVLLIVAILPPALLGELIAVGRDLGLTPLVEVAREEEARIAVDSGAKVIGINNRDLRTFEVDLETTARLRRLIPDDRIVLALSGIGTKEDVERIRSWGVDGMLVGESLMRASDPGKRAAELIAWGGA